MTGRRNWLPDVLLVRWSLWLAIACFQSVAPLSLVYTLAWIKLYPAPPLLAFLPLDWVEDHDSLARLASSYFVLEAAWRVVHLVGTGLQRRGWCDLHASRLSRELEWREHILPDERWRLWRNMLASSNDPWSGWLGAWFARPDMLSKDGVAPLGAQDPSVTTIQPEELGKDNVAEFLARMLFEQELESFKPRTLDTAQLKAMVYMLEKTIATARGYDGASWRFRPGRTRHRALRLASTPSLPEHRPLVFHALAWMLGCTAELLLWLCGFSYFGPRSLFRSGPWWFMHGGSIEKLDALHASEDRGDALMAEQVGYWYHPGSRAAQRECRMPIIAAQGGDGGILPNLFLALVQRFTGRAMFIPEQHYRTPRYTVLLSKDEVVEAMRRMLWRHGFGDTHVPDEDEKHEHDGDEDDDEEEETWRRGQAIFLGRSLGSTVCGWALREAPDIVASAVLIDPTSYMNFSGDLARSLGQTTHRTSRELFFSYFSSERPLADKMSRHLKWSDSVIFSAGAHALPDAVMECMPKLATVEQDPRYDMPYLAPAVNPTPRAPFPTKVFLTSSNCVLPVDKVARVLEGADGFKAKRVEKAKRSTGLVSRVRELLGRRATTSSERLSMAKDEHGSLVLFNGVEYADVLTRPWWMFKVARAVEQVTKASIEANAKEVPLPGN